MSEVAGILFGAGIGVFAALLLMLVVHIVREL